ncbi:MAG: M48 family metallopeptidase [Saprospiraceae bacterium]|nr:M48 family metallopeptidase [Saprospiraceae bacterium]
MRTKIINSSIKVDDIVIPVEVFKEFRMDVRTVIRQNKMIIRLPIYYGSAEIKKSIKNAEEWVKGHIDNNAALKKRFEIKEYKSSDELFINGVKFILELKESDISNYKAQLDNNIIKISVPRESDKRERNEALIYLQSKLTGNYFLPEIIKRIEDLNKKYFNVNINGVKLKYNKSNWGSRSVRNNINISTRLLFAPKDVQDYVFIHELAHFIEMNHSKRFWDIVRAIMPDYREKELWLKKNGPKCDF